MKHINQMVTLTSLGYQGICSCGWSSTISNFEEADLLRAMHAHAVQTFKSYQE